MSHTSTLRLRKLLESFENIEESIELIEISRQSFQAKLKDIRLEISQTQDQEKINNLMFKVNNLYKQYCRSLDIIEKFIDEQGEKLSLINQKRRIL